MLTSVEQSDNPLISTARMDLLVEYVRFFLQHHDSAYNLLSCIRHAPMKKRIKLEFFDRTGSKHSLAIEGDFTIEKVNRLLEYAEIVAGSNVVSSLPPQESKINRMLDVINTRLPNRTFDSRALWQAYRDVWGDDFSLGAVSTYLSRLVDRGTLDREGSPAHWFYKLKPSSTLAQ